MFYFVFSGNILGRRMLQFKSCVSPKRDHAHSFGTPKGNTESHPHGKRPLIKKEEPDTSEESVVVTGPNGHETHSVTISLPSEALVKKLVAYTYDILCSEQTRRPSSVPDKFFKDIKKLSSKYFLKYISKFFLDRVVL